MTKQNQTKQPRASCTREFRKESIYMALGGGCKVVGIMKTARRLPNPLSTVSRWIDAYRKSGEVKASSRQCTPESSEFSRLKRETCKQRKKFKSTTNSKHSLPIAENVLDRQFIRSACNEA